MNAERTSGERIHQLGELRDMPLYNTFSPAVRTFSRVFEKMLRILPESELDAKLVDKTMNPLSDDAVTAARAIAEGSQENFITTWVSRAMQKGTIIVTLEDKQNHPNTDFDAAGTTLFSYRDQTMKVETDHPAFQPDILHDIRATVATNRITHAVVKNTVEGTERLFMVGIGAGLVEEMFQKMFGLGPIAYSIASSADDLPAIYVEGRKLFRQGYSKKEAVAAMRIPLLIWMSAVGVSFVVHHEFQMDNKTVAGVLYGAESAICVFPSLFAALNTLRPAYEKLVQDNKVNDPVMANLLEKKSVLSLNKFEEVQKYLVGLQRALVHDLAYPHHAGLAIGAVVGIFLSTLAANISLGEGRLLLQDPRILVPLGLADSIGAALASALIDPIYRIDLLRNLKKVGKRAYGTT